MTVLTKKTAKMLCIRSLIARSKLPEAAQRILELFEDPDVSPEQKAVVKAELDAYIKKVQDRATTRRMRDPENRDFESSKD